MTVTDPKGRYVTGLQKEDFRLFEDGIEQEISQFSSTDSRVGGLDGQLLSVGILFDAGGSMGAKLEQARQAVARFLKMADPDDEFFLVHFNDRPRLVTGFTSDVDEILRNLTFTAANGRTALFDGLYMAAHQMKTARHARKALLVISDGGDNASRYTESEVRIILSEAEVPIYTIGISTQFPLLGRRPQEVSPETSGHHFRVDSMVEVPDVAASIGIALRNQYVLGYAPKNTGRDGAFRQVQVQVEARGLPPLRVRAKPGYRR